MDGRKTYHAIYKSKAGMETIRFDTIEVATAHLQGERDMVNTGPVSRFFAEDHGLVLLGYDYIQSFEVKDRAGKRLGYVVASERPESA